MQLLQQLWFDEQGAVLSAEVATVATVGVMGTVVGLNAMTDAVNGELRDASQSFRSLDQSYHFAGFRTCRAWYAGSCFQQRPVGETLPDMWGPQHRLPAGPHHPHPDVKPQPVPMDESPRDEKRDNDAQAIESIETPASEKL